MLGRAASCKHNRANMRSQKCSSCGENKSLQGMFQVNQQVYCEPCADKTVVQLQEMNAPLDVIKMVDPSICAKCGGDAGSGSFGVVGGAPLCPACTETAYNYSFPGWLKAGLAFTLLLLVVALWQGAPYFRTGRKLFRAEHLIDQKQHEAAVPFLADVIKAAPNCEKCVLLFAKAELLTGHPDVAYSVVQAHNGGRFEQSDLFRELEALFKKVDRAGELVEKAGEQEQAGKHAEAMALIQQARAAYPEWQVLGRAEEQIAIGEAFDRKDYDTFVAKAEAIDARDKDSYSAAQLASALACKYAASGDENYRARAEQMLAKADEMSQQSAEARKSFEEYSERIRHRLKTKLIIGKAEYDRTVRHVSAGDSK